MDNNTALSIGIGVVLAAAGILATLFVTNKKKNTADNSVTQGGSQKQVVSGGSASIQSGRDSNIGNTDSQ